MLSVMFAGTVHNSDALQVKRVSTGACLDWQLPERGCRQHMLELCTKTSAAAAKHLLLPHAAAFCQLLMLLHSSGRHAPIWQATETPD